MKQIKDTSKVLNDDFIINDIKINKEVKYHCISQCDKEFVTIEKYVYKKHNEVFVNLQQKESPKCKCIFTLHTDQKSSYVEIFDNKNNSIFLGNSLWSDGHSKSPKEHIKYIKQLHSVIDVKNNYGA